MSAQVSGWLVIAFFGGAVLMHTLWVFEVLHPRKKLLERMREHEVRMDREWNAFFAELDQRLSDVRSITAEEREECARIADGEEEAWQDGESNATTCRIIAAAIRARGGQ